LTMKIFIEDTGKIKCLYNEALDIRRLGKSRIQRAAWVEPGSGENQDKWVVTLADGTFAGVFNLRSDALKAEENLVVRRLQHGTGT
jgi:hypothetical protein